MKKVLFFVTLCLISTLSFSENYSDIFWTTSCIGIVEDNSVRFYDFDNISNSWKSGPISSLILPTGCTKVLPITTKEVLRGVGIVFAGTVQFYDYDILTNSWSSTPSSCINLPTDWSDIISIEVGIGATGFWIIKDNTIQFCSHTASKRWIYNSSRLKLPKGYMDVLPIAPRWYLCDMAIIKNNEIQFYSRENDSDFWHPRRFSNLNFKLRDGYSDVFLMIVQEKFTVGVVIENTVHFIFYENHSWKPGPYPKLLL